MELPRFRTAALGGGGFVLLLCLACGCAQVVGTMATVPPQWRKTNPWSPESYEARARGELKDLFYTQQMADWAAWAQDHLQDGDVLFRFGLAASLRQRLGDRVTTTMSDTRFTHVAITFRHADGVWVYDAEPEPLRVRKMPFEVWNLDTVPDTLTVKRVREPYRHAIPAALGYCEDAWRRQVPFDSALRLDDERLYCSEMIEKGFRTGGVALSDPTPIRCLPRYNRYRVLRPLAERFTEYRVDEPVFSLGNALYGLYGSPYLELVHGGDPCKKPKAPICPPVPFPPDGVGCAGGRG